MKTYTIEQWPAFLKDINGMVLKINAEIGGTVRYITIKPADLREVIVRSNIKTFTVDIHDTCAFVE